MAPPSNWKEIKAQSASMFPLHSACYGIAHISQVSSNTVDKTYALNEWITSIPGPLNKGQGVCPGIFLLDNCSWVGNIAMPFMELRTSFSGFP